MLENESIGGFVFVKIDIFAVLCKTCDFKVKSFASLTVKSKAIAFGEIFC